MVRKIFVPRESVDFTGDCGHHSEAVRIRPLLVTYPMYKVHPRMGYKSPERE